MGGTTVAAAVGAVVLFAATFLHSPVREGLWDETVFLAADEDVAPRRGVAAPRVVRLGPVRRG